MKALMTVAISVILFPTAFFGFYAQADEMDQAEAALSCANPRSEDVAYCSEIEQAILASTVRIEMRSWIVYVEGVGHTQLNGGGHATVKDGRYLVTHNHYDNIPLSAFTDKELSQYLKVSVYRTSGELLLEAPATTISVAAVDTETLVFDFGAASGVGLFESLGVPSASFLAVENSPLRPGMEVGQIDWDGTNAHIEWTTIDAVTSDGGTPVLKLGNCVEFGASGGGVFWQGRHVGNNWSRSPACGLNSGDPTEFVSSAALNSFVIAS